MRRHFPFFEIAGEPYEVGRSHGEQLRDAIHRQLEETLDVARRQGGLSRQQALDWAMEQLPKIEALGGAAWIHELRGLADGAQIPLAAAASLQVRPGTGFMPEGCTSLGVSCDASATGLPLGAQNRDLVPAYRGRMCVLLLRPRGRAALLMHSVPGELGGVGINEHGVAVFANSLWPRAGRNWQAPPVTRRALLECRSADEAAERARAMNGPAVGSFLLIDAAGRIRNLEILPQALAVVARDRGVFAHANHCLDPGVKAHEVEQLPSPGSPGRCARMQALLDAVAGRVSVEDIKRMLADHAGRPEPLCRHATSAAEWETTSALIAEPASRTLHLSYGPPCEGSFATYRIT
jgi:isopenicillin-N N-acyltransferase-like protein